MRDEFVSQSPILTRAMRTSDYLVWQKGGDDTELDMAKDKGKVGALRVFSKPYPQFPNKITSKGWKTLTTPSQSLLSIRLPAASVSGTLAPLSRHAR